MTLFLQQVINGIMLGSVYSLFDFLQQKILEY
jgi:branched-subunit amino acid ABC-type transport system permease component